MLKSHTNIYVHIEGSKRVRTCDFELRFTLSHKLSENHSVIEDTSLFGVIVLKIFKLAFKNHVVVYRTRSMWFVIFTP